MVTPPRPRRASRAALLSLLTSGLVPVACKSAAPPPVEGEPPAGVVGMNASPTADPARFDLFRPMRSQGLRVGIAPLDDPAGIAWLEPGTQYILAPDRESITLLAEPRPDPVRAYVFVTGVPEPGNVFLFHRPLEPGTVRVQVNDRELREGEGFVLEATSGRVRVLDPAFATPGARYALSAGSVAIGNAPRD